jgi:hypothetical protein
MLRRYLQGLKHLEHVLRFLIKYLCVQQLEGIGKDEHLIFVLSELRDLSLALLSLLLLGSFTEVVRLEHILDYIWVFLLLWKHHPYQVLIDSGQGEYLFDELTLKSYHGIESFLAVSHC